MAVNLFCPVCKKSSKLGTVKCKCGNNFKTKRKYRARVKLPNGKWISKVVDSLELAKDVEAKYRSEKVVADVWDKYTAPSIDKVWKAYIKWAEQNKRSWKSDKGRWEIHISKHVGGKRMDRITPQMVQRMISELSLTESTSTRNKGTLLSPATVMQMPVAIS